MTEDVILLPARPVAVAARYIEQAYELIKETGASSARLYFIDDNCVGVDSRNETKAPLRQKIERQKIERPVVKRRPFAGGDTSKADSLTTADIMESLQRTGPTNTRRLAEHMAIPSMDKQARSRLSRILKRLARERIIGRSEGRFADWVLLRPDAPVPEIENRPVRLERERERQRLARKIPRKTVSLDDVLRILTDAGTPLSTQAISDKMGIERRDQSTRARISYLVRIAQQENMIRRAEGKDKFMNVYEIAPQGKTAQTT